MVHYIMQIVNHFYNLNKKKGTVLFLEEKGDGSIFGKKGTVLFLRDGELCKIAKNNNVVIPAKAGIQCFQ